MEGKQPEANPGHVPENSNVDKATKLKGRYVFCVHPGCESKVLFEDLDHHEDTCGHAVVKCIYCPEEMKRQFQPEHQANCDFRQINCDKCRFSGNVKNDHKCDSVTFLMGQVDTLKSVIETIKSEHNTTVEMLKADNRRELVRLEQRFNDEITELKEKLNVMNLSVQL